MTELNWKYYTSKFILYKWKIWEMQSMKYKEVRTYLKFNDQRFSSMGKPHHTQLEASSHLKPCISSGKSTRPSFPPSILPSILTLFQKELQAAAWQWLSSLNQASVQAFLPFLLVPPVITTETQGHEVSKAKISKEEHFDWGQGTKMTRDNIMIS